MLGMQCFYLGSIIIVFNLKLVYSARHFNCDKVCEENGHDIDGTVNIAHEGPHEPHGHSDCQGHICVVLRKDYNKFEAPQPGFEKPVKGNKFHTTTTSVEESCDDKEVTSALEVQTEFDLTGIRGVNQKHGVLEFEMYVSMEWSDPNIGLCTCKIAPEFNNASLGKEGDPYYLKYHFENDIWVPDLAIWDYISFIRMKGLVLLNDLTLTVKKNCPARLFYGFDVLVKTRCEMDVSQYPFDLNVCHIKIGSYSQSSEEVIFKRGQEVPHLFTREKFEDFDFHVVPLCEKEKVQTTTGFLQTHEIEHKVTGISLTIGRNNLNIIAECVVTMSILVSISIFSIFLPIVSGRSGVLVSSMLSLIFILVVNSETTAHSPGLSNPVIMFNLLCLVFIIIIFLEYVYVVYKNRNDGFADENESETVIKIDKTFFFVTLFSYIMFTTLYWLARKWYAGEHTNYSCHNDVKVNCRHD